MPLKQRQQIARIQAETLPDYNARLEQYTGAPITYDIDWDTFEDGEAIFGLTGLLTNISNGIEAITRDQVGKDAVAAGFQRIVVKNLADGETRKIAVEDGVFHVYSVLEGDDYDNRVGVNDIIHYLENHL